MDFISTVYALGLIKLEEIDCELKNTKKPTQTVDDIRSKIESALQELHSASDEFSPAWVDNISDLTVAKIIGRAPNFWIGVLQGVIGTFIAGIVAFLFILAAPYLVSIAKNISGDVSKILNGNTAEGCSSNENPNC